MAKTTTTTEQATQTTTSPSAQAAIQAASSEEYKPKYPTKAIPSKFKNDTHEREVLTGVHTEDEALRLAGEYNIQVPLNDGTGQVALPNGPVVAGHQNR